MATTEKFIRRFSTRELTTCALLAALTAVCSQISIPLPMVPLNLALLAVYLSGTLLGPMLGAASQLIFICVGAVGIPVFANFSGGVGVLAGPTGGYLLGYLAAGLVTGLCTRGKPGFWRLCGAMALGLLLCYTFGTIWFLVLTGKTLAGALAICVFPFLPGDALKIAAAAAVTLRLRGPLKAYTAK